MSLIELPTDVLGYMLQFASVRSANHLACTCRRMQRVCAAVPIDDYLANARDVDTDEDALLRHLCEARDFVELRPTKFLSGGARVAALYGALRRLVAVQLHCNNTSWQYVPNSRWHNIVNVWMRYVLPVPGRTFVLACMSRIRPVVRYALHTRSPITDDLCAQANLPEIRYYTVRYLIAHADALGICVEEPTPLSPPLCFIDRFIACGGRARGMTGQAAAKSVLTLCESQAMYDAARNHIRARRPGLLNDNWIAGAVGFGPLPALARDNTVCWSKQRDAKTAAACAAANGDHLLLRVILEQCGPAIRGAAPLILEWATESGNPLCVRAVVELLPPPERAFIYAKDVYTNSFTLAELDKRST